MTSPTPDHWQIQDAKQRFSEMIRAVMRDGPQVITRHGEDVAVVVDIAEYRRLTRPAVARASANDRKFAPFHRDLQALLVDAGHLRLEHVTDSIGGGLQTEEVPGVYRPHGEVPDADHVPAAD